MTKSEVPAEILARIKKCLALTKSNFENEAAVALSMATKLMEQYGLSHKDLDMDADGQIKEERIVKEGTDSRFMWPWEKDLAGIIKVLMPVEMIFYTDRGGWTTKHSAMYFGTPSDVALAVEIYAILRKELLAISIDEPAGLERRSFLTGCTDSLRARAQTIKHNREKEKAAAAAGPVTGGGLMVVKSNQIRKWVNDRIPHKPMRQRGSSVNDDAYGRGLDAGDKINLDFNNSLAPKRS